MNKPCYEGDNPDYYFMQARACAEILPQTLYSWHVCLCDLSSYPSSLAASLLNDGAQCSTLLCNYAAPYM